MKAAAFFDKRDVRVIDVPRPKVSETGVLIKVHTCGVCGTDLTVFQTGKFLRTSSGEVAGYRVLGHEFAGEIVEAGSEVRDFQEGDRVICAHVKGGFAEYIHVEKAVKNVNVFHLPDSISFRAAATLEPLFISYHSAVIARPVVGENAVVIGGGMVGLGIIQVLKAISLNEIFVVDLSEKRLEAAGRLGAEHLINPGERSAFDTIAEVTGTEPVRYLSYETPRADMVFECAGAPVTPGLAFSLARPRSGRVVVISLFKDETKVDLNDIVLKNISILGMLGFSDDHILQVMQLVDAGRIERESLITHEFPLDDIQRGFESQFNTGESIKAVIHMHGSS